MTDKSSSCPHSNTKSSSWWHPSSSPTEAPFGQRTSHGRGRTIHPGRKRTLNIKLILRSKDEGNSVEEEGSEITEASPTPVRAPQGTGGPTLAKTSHPVSHNSEPSLLAIIQQMNHIMANLQAASSSEASRLPL
ncbi:hypothetical protein O181_087153 [Austropuccinia psidii MF-1]|uniref:Uncharacterized protein n=1 Tax=Austropuccinia psidii MF-1 TaxID=1389203 RepID=A0A9Q3IP53_9BASI|nr:hypothetical protein [Austropuccinia psidii MF-1]